MNKAAAIALFAVAPLAILPLQAHAQTRTWLPTSGNWNVPADWSSGTVPLSTNNAVIDNSGTAIVPATVSASASTLWVGYSGTGNLTVSGGTLADSNGYLGFNGGSFGKATVSSGSWSSSAALYVGDSGTGTLNLIGSGVVNIASGTGTLSLASLSGASGTLNFGSGATAGTLDASSVSGGSGTAAVNFNLTGTYAFAPQLQGNLSVSLLGTGTVSLTGSESYAGNTTISAGSLVISGYDTLATGTLTAPGSAGGFSTQGSGTFVMNGTGVENGYFQNFGTFQYSSGTFNGMLENDGTISLSGVLSTGSGILNNSVISVATGYSAYAGGTGLNNESQIYLTGGTIGGASTLNNGLISGYGTISGSNLTNYGQITQSGGNITLSSSGTNTNYGNIGLASGLQLRLSGSNLSNQGTINLNGGIVTGSATLVNTSGGSVNGYGSIQTTFTNTNGIISLTGGALNITQAFTNAGTIQLGALTANLTGGAITNNTSIQGFGSIGSNITNAGTIEPSGGTLILNGTFSNGSAGLITAGTGGELLINTGLATNAGIISLTGGIVDNNGNAMNNTGQISGYGTLRVGTGTNGLTNNGTISFTGGPTTVNGSVTNAAGMTITVSYNPATFTGNVTNNGIFVTMHTTVSFSGTFTNDGEYVSDPSTQNFANLAIGKNGSLVGGSDDTYKVSGNVTNTSSQAGAFNIKASTLTLEGTVNHQFTWSGADLGATAAGYENNFAIGTLELQAGGSLTVLDGNESGNAGVYVSVLELDGGLAQIGSITGNGANIYYDASAAGNAYLGDQDYALQNGGELEAIQAIPEPGTVSLLAMGMLVGMGLLGRRKKQ